nr:MAG TPA: single-stranded DNA-binding protein [Caudoviricetes sp.]
MVFSNHASNQASNRNDNNSNQKQQSPQGGNEPPMDFDDSIPF